MGLAFQEGEFKITQYGRTENAQIKFEDALGLQKQKDGSWMMVGDPYHCKNKDLRKYYGNGSQFDKDLKVAYAITEAKEQLESMNFQCTENEAGTIGKNGKIRLVFSSLV